MAYPADHDHQLASHHPADKGPISAQLIVDNPPGFALARLEALAAQRLLLRRGHLAQEELRPHATVVVTYNLCVEHWEDLWELGPDVLLVGPADGAEIAVALEHAAQGKIYRVTPRRESVLSRTERLVLHWVARGLCDKQIATLISLHDKTVANRLCEIYSKLNLENRTQAALYYWGLWDVLQTIQPLRSIDDVPAARSPQAVPFYAAPLEVSAGSASPLFNSGLPESERGPMLVRAADDSSVQVGPARYIPRVDDGSSGQQPND